VVATPWFSTAPLPGEVRKNPVPNYNGELQGQGSLQNTVHIM